MNECIQKASRGKKSGFENKQKRLREKFTDLREKRSTQVQKTIKNPKKIHKDHQRSTKINKDPQRSARALGDLVNMQ